VSKELDDQNTRITKLETEKTNFKNSGKADAAGLLDLSGHAGFASMELTRLGGAEGRKGNGR